MAHRFNRTENDPYVIAAHQIEATMFAGKGGTGDYAAGAEEEIYEALGNAIVTGLGDIVGTAFRLGVNSSTQLRGLTDATAKTATSVFSSYEGEVDPEPALQALESDSRFTQLPTVAQEDLKREIEKTRQLEHLLLTARRLPQLLDYAASLGLRMQEDHLGEGQLLVGLHPTPTAETS